MTAESDAFSRREALALGGSAALALALAPDFALGDVASTEAELKRLYGERPMEESRIKLDLPPIAENGLVVPVNIEVESPMTDEDHVKAVHLFAEGNPAPRVASFYFTPANGKAATSTRIRLAKTQTVVAVCEMSSGALHVARAEIKVTIGGCG